MRSPLFLGWAALAAAGMLAATGCQSSGTTMTARNETPPPKPAESAAPAPKAAAPAVALDAVYFDFDRWELRDDARQALQSSATQIKARPEWGTLMIEGHCDARGSDEYNMALGERRAGAVKRYLVDLGVPSSRLDTVSYGESRPAARGDDEIAWRLNRRSELRIGSLASR